MLTKQQEEVIYHFVLLSIAKRVLELDLASLEKVPLKLKMLYIERTVHVMDQISQELANVRKQMKVTKLHITKLRNDGTFTFYLVKTKDYECTKQYLNIHLKRQIFQYIEEKSRS
ncbi:hypothetical protein [Alkalihalobacterium bogoriense]|uniref:hypothetical protein n=1 Tax=Alkalihalobacterium bogoriense TaxID=246272 RepID=UPI00047AFA9F|nr:hypothetical protein [Alkalihalobacterium bogoriense]